MWVCVFVCVCGSAVACAVTFFPNYCSWAKRVINIHEYGTPSEEITDGALLNILSDVARLVYNGTVITYWGVLFTRFKEVSAWYTFFASSFLSIREEKNMIVT